MRNSTNGARARGLIPVSGVNSVIYFIPLDIKGGVKSLFFPTVFHNFEQIDCVELLQKLMYFLMKRPARLKDLQAKILLQTQRIKYLNIQRTKHLAEDYFDFTEPDFLLF